MGRMKPNTLTALSIAGHAKTYLEGDTFGARRPVAVGGDAVAIGGDAVSGTGPVKKLTIAAK